MTDLAPDLMLYPVFALVLLTFAVGFRLLHLRFAAVRRGDVKPGFFVLGRGGREPEYLAKVSHNYSNLFELPVLFYLAAALIHASGRVDAINLGLAWLFVITRVAHSLIHTGSNNLMQRMPAFVAGVAVLLLLWLEFLWRTLAA